MNPTAFRINGFEIRWYGILIWIGVIAAMLLTYYNCKRKKIDFNILFDGFLVCFPAAIIGARLYYVAFEFESFKGNLLSIVNLRTGGLAIHGGLIGAAIAVFFYIKYKKLDAFKYLDIVAPSIILAQGIGRWGNFMNGEAHGGIVSYEFISKFPKFIQEGMHISGNYYHPTFLYESMWNFICCIILLVILHKSKDDDKGIVIASYLILYSTGRVFIEGLRTDSLMFYGIRVAQLVSIVLIIIGIVLIVIRRNTSKNKKSK